MPVTSLQAAESCATSKELVDENIYPLNQLNALLLLLPCTLYQQLFDTQSVGKHVRHVLEHYQTLLAGLKDGVQICNINYEQRARQAALEEDPGVATQAVDKLRAELQALAHQPADITIMVNYSVDPSGNNLTLPSSLGRELAFLMSHTVHHMALIRLLCESMNMSVSSDFGVHPSTLRFWQQNMR
ncbi:hypothetical protein ACFIOZ_10990 [Vreelandella sp. F11]|uniref:hypothetical protein n=1 Tax=Vreelandella sp. F11 TaxID=3394751 RepID=UPI0036DF4E19